MQEVQPACRDALSGDVRIHHDNILNSLEKGTLKPTAKPTRVRRTMSQMRSGAKDEAAADATNSTPENSSVFRRPHTSPRNPPTMVPRMNPAGPHRGSGERLGGGEAGWWRFDEREGRRERGVTGGMGERGVPPKTTPASMPSCSCVSPHSSCNVVYNIEITTWWIFGATSEKF